MALFAILQALIVIPLEVIPFACAIPGLSIGFFAIGPAAEDKLYTLFALLVGVGALWMTWFF